MELTSSPLRFVDARNTAEAAKLYEDICEKYGAISHLLAIHGYVERHHRFPSHFTINKYGAK